ncbi:unnamed protein product [Prunus armeniaca]
MKDLDLLHRENMAPRPILKISLGLARDATHEANLVDYQNQKSELDALVANYKETKSAASELERHIQELRKQLAALRDRQKVLGVGLGVKTKSTFLVQSMVSASRPSLEIAKASIHQGALLQKEISIKKAGL